MPDKVRMPADGGGRAKGQPDGVSGSPDSGQDGRPHGRFAGGESAGGAYPNAHHEAASDADGFLGHGGQSEIDYHGGPNPNATAGGSTPDEESGTRLAASPDREPHQKQVGGQSIEVVEGSGVAAAEATGKVATDAPYEDEQETPGGG